MEKETIPQQSVADKNREIKIRREVNNQAELFYKDAVDIGDHAAYALGRSHRSQFTGLENVAESALKITDIFDYVKRQTARYNYWRIALPYEPKEIFGERLRSYLEKNLAEVRDKACEALQIGNTSDEEKRLRRRVYLLLVRQFIRQMVVQYEYRVNAEGLGNHNGAGKR
jgi:hypothetical protein